MRRVAHQIGLIQNLTVADFVRWGIGALLIEAGQNQDQAHIGQNGPQFQQGFGCQKIKTFGTAAKKIGAAVGIQGGNVPQQSVTQGLGIGRDFPVTGKNTDFSHGGAPF